MDKQENKLARAKARRFLGYLTSIRTQYLQQLTSVQMEQTDRNKLKYKLNTLNNDISELATEWFEKDYDKEDDAWETVKQGE